MFLNIVTKVRTYFLFHPANFQAATSQLLGSLERISATYGVDQGPIMETASELHEINKIKASVEAGKQRYEYGDLGFYFATYRC